MCALSLSQGTQRKSCVVDRLGPVHEKFPLRQCRSEMLAGLPRVEVQESQGEVSPWR